MNARNAKDTHPHYIQTYARPHSYHAPRWVAPFLVSRYTRLQKNEERHGPRNTLNTRRYTVLHNSWAQHDPSPNKSFLSVSKRRVGIPETDFLHMAVFHHRRHGHAHWVAITELVRSQLKTLYWFERKRKIDTSVQFTGAWEGYSWLFRYFNVEHHGIFVTINVEELSAPLNPTVMRDIFYVHLISWVQTSEQSRHAADQSSYDFMPPLMTQLTWMLPDTQLARIRRCAKHAKPQNAMKTKF